MYRADFNDHFLPHAPFRLPRRGRFLLADRPAPAPAGRTLGISLGVARNSTQTNAYTPSAPRRRQLANTTSRTKVGQYHQARSALSNLYCTDLARRSKPQHQYYVPVARLAQSLHSEPEPLRVRAIRRLSLLLLLSLRRRNGWRRWKATVLALNDSKLVDDLVRHGVD